MANAMNTGVTPIKAVTHRGRPLSNQEGQGAAKAQYRLQVKLTDEGRERVEELVTRSRHRTAADLVRDALRVYEILLEEVAEKSGQLYIKDGDTGDMEKLRILS